MSDIKNNYSSYYYSGKKRRHVYRADLVLRALIGNNPRLKNDPDSYGGLHVLDLGCGDGRNMPLFRDLGMHICGVEISEEICSVTAERMESYGIEVDLRAGTNRNIPFEDNRFDCVVACHSCYYVEEGSCFADNLSEMLRVMNDGARFVASLADVKTYLLDGADDIGDGHYRINNDPFGLRNGSIFRAFNNDEEVLSMPGAAFRPNRDWNME